MQYNWRAKIPISLVLLFLLNFAVIMALELLLFYRMPVPLTADALAGYDSAYKNCTILQEAQRGKLNCCLVETADGQIHMVPTHGHSLVYTRARVLKKYITVIPEDTEVTVPVKIGIHTSNVTVSIEPLSHTQHIAIDHYSSNIQTTTTLYMALAAVLEAIELAIFHIIRYGLP